MVMEHEASLKEGEPHAAAISALIWYRKLPLEFLSLAREAFSSVAIAGNHNADVCLATMKRLDQGKGVSDRYMLGLAWLLKEMHEKDKEIKIRD